MIGGLAKFSNKERLLIKAVKGRRSKERGEKYGNRECCVETQFCECDYIMQSYMAKLSSLKELLSQMSESNAVDVRLSWL